MNGPVAAEKPEVALRSRFEPVASISLRVDPSRPLRRRVVVTGLGAVTPIGNDVETSWKALVHGESGARGITLFDPSDCPVRFACEVKDFDATRWMDPKQVRGVDRFVQMAVAAARQAVEDAALDLSANSDRIGTSVATGIGGVSGFEENVSGLLERGPKAVSPFLVPSALPNMAAAWVSILLGTEGPLRSSCAACAAGSIAIADAAEDIRSGRADVMLCGGSEAPITRVAVLGFAAMRALSRRNDEPARASRPFSAGRDGFVMGEGAAILVLEELEHARRRGARIYGELLGSGLTSDATHLTRPDPTGAGPARAIRVALADAGIKPQEVGYVNAHGTSTPLGDASETRVLKLALGEGLARTVPVSSTKAATGHCLGATGAIEAVFTVLAIQRGVLPPTINYEPDPECDLDYLPNRAREAEIDVAISNSFGFGGHNVCLIFGRYSPAGGFS